jgi:hypothetical protein
MKHLAVVFVVHRLAAALAAEGGQHDNMVLGRQYVVNCRSERAVGQLKDLLEIAEDGVDTLVVEQAPLALAVVLHVVAAIHGNLELDHRAHADGSYLWSTNADRVTDCAAIWAEPFVYRRSDAQIPPFVD